LLFNSLVTTLKYRFSILRKDDETINLIIAKFKLLQDDLESSRYNSLFYYIIANAFYSESIIEIILDINNSIVIPLPGDIERISKFYFSFGEFILKVQSLPPLTNYISLSDGSKNESIYKTEKILKNWAFLTSKKNIFSIYTTQRQLPHKFEFDKEMIENHELLVNLLNREIKTQNLNLELINESLSVKEKLLSEMYDENMSLKEMINQSKDEENKMSSMNEELKKKLQKDKSTKTILELQKTLQEKKDKIVALERTSTDQQTRIHNLANEIEKKKKQITETNKQMNEKNKEITMIREDMSRQINDKEKQYQKNYETSQTAYSEMKLEYQGQIDILQLQLFSAEEARQKLWIPNPNSDLRELVELKEKHMNSISKIDTLIIQLFQSYVLMKYLIYLAM
jgi:hypothetical protein